MNLNGFRYEFGGRFCFWRQLGQILGKEFLVKKCSKLSRYAHIIRCHQMCVPKTNFRGIEIRDFPAEVARLALVIAENIATDGAMGRLFLTLISSIAELEADLIKERVRAGIRRRRLEGLRVGRQPLDVDHASLVEDRLRGMSLTEVAKRYGVSRASVVRWVRLARQSNSAVGAAYQAVRELREEVAA